MPEPPLKIIEKLDPELKKIIDDTNANAFNDGVLSKKIKLIIALALDASNGASEGVKALTKAALEAGAKKEEIMEAMRVVNYVCGVGSVYTAANAFREIFKD
jgi:alkylhydroperoxidase/carboxymuconolactone decarboxylase family protein YurZ